MPSETAFPWVARTPFFYGWVIVALATLAIFVSGPGQTYVAAVFVDPMLEDLGWSRTLIAGLYSVGSLTAAIAMIGVGRLLDRLGARVMLTGVAILFGVAAIGMSKVTHPAHLYAGFAAIRILGQGSLTFIPTTLVSLWFVRQRGKATAITSLGSTASASFFPPFIHFMISRLDWRGAWAILALIIWFALLAPAVLLARRSPESIGLLPDGGPPSPQAEVQETSTPAVREVEWTLGEALRTPALWLLLFAGSAVSLISTGLGFNQISLLTSKGLDAGVAAAVFSIMGPASLFGALIAGYLADRLPNRYLLVAGQAVLALAMLWTFVITSPWQGFVYGVLMSMGSRFILTINTVIWPNYYGRSHLGSIRGVATSGMMLSTALGPLPFALLYDLSGTYSTAILIFLSLPVACAAAALLAPPPQKRPLG